MSINAVIATKQKFQKRFSKIVDKTNKCPQSRLKFAYILNLIMSSPRIADDVVNLETVTISLRLWSAPQLEKYS